MSKKSLGSQLLVVLGLLFIAVIGCRTISTPEIWTHLALGRANAAISFATDNTVNTTWLYDKLAYAAWSVGGANLLILLNIAGLLAAFILLLQVSKKWGGPISQGFALLIAGHLIFHSVDVGPGVVMMLFIAATLYLAGQLKNPTALYAVMVPVQILWTNMHGSFLLGPLIVGLMAIQSIQRDRAGRSRKGGLDANTYGIAAGAMLVSTLVNPYLFQMHLQVFASIASPAPYYWSSLFAEYFQLPPLKPLVLLVVVLGACGMITLKKKLPITLTTMAAIGAFLALGPSLSLYLLFAVLTFPFVVLSLKSISEFISASLTQMMGGKAKWLVPATGTILAVLLIGSMVPIARNCAYVRTGSASNFGLGIEEELYPSGAAALLEDPAFPEKAINLKADGGYLAFKYGRKMFIDYRSGRYDKSLLIDLDNLLKGDRNAYNSIMEKYRPEAFIINALDTYASQGIFTLVSSGVWKLVYFDGVTAVLVANKPEFESILNNAAVQEAGLKRLEQARADYAAQAGACSAGNPAALIGAGKIYLALNRSAESKAIYSLLLQGNGRIASAWIGLGQSQLFLGEFEDGAESLKKATALAPSSMTAWQKYAAACEMCVLRLKDDEKIDHYRKEGEIASARLAHLARKARKSEESEAAPASPIVVGGE